MIDKAHSEPLTMYTAQGIEYIYIYIYLYIYIGHSYIDKWFAQLVA